MLIALVPWLALALAPAPSTTADRDSSVIRLTPQGERGDRLIVTGQVVDAGGRPVPGATLSVYHADAMGDYAKLGASTPRLSGTVRTGRTASFRIETVVPSQLRNLEGGAPHIHGVASAPGRANAGFVVNLTLAPGRHADANLLASLSGRRSIGRTIYQDTLGTWHLVFDPTLP